MLSALADEGCLGGATGPLVVAATRRGIPAYRRDSEIRKGDATRRFGGLRGERVCYAFGHCLWLGTGQSWLSSYRPRRSWQA